MTTSSNWLPTTTENLSSTSAKDPRHSSANPLIAYPTPFPLSNRLSMTRRDSIQPPSKNKRPGSRILHRISARAILPMTSTAQDSSVPRLPCWWPSRGQVLILSKGQDEFAYGPAANPIWRNKKDIVELITHGHRGRGGSYYAMTRVEIIFHNGEDPLNVSCLLLE